MSVSSSSLLSTTSTLCSSEILETDLIKEEIHFCDDDHFSCDEHHFISTDDHLISSDEHHFISTDDHLISSDEHHFISTDDHLISSDEHHFISSEEHHLISRDDNFISSEEHHLISRDDNLISSEDHLISSEENHMISTDDHHLISSEGISFDSDQLVETSIKEEPLNRDGVMLLCKSAPNSFNEDSELLTPSPRSTNSEPSFQLADSSPAQSTHIKSFVACKVCGDKASGYHYGVTSCEGCKGFFRRSIQKQIEYRCLRDGKCLVIRLNRNRCQFCRFKKCLSVGMSRDSVRYGRVPKRSRDREGSVESRNGIADSSFTESVSSPSDNHDQAAAYEVILTISQAHHANCNYTEEKTRNLVKKHIIFKPIVGNNTDAETASSTYETLEHEKINWWQSLAVFITPSIPKVVEFAKRVPGFIDLSQDDQLMLIKGGFFELWLARASRLISSAENTFMFNDGSCFSRHQLEFIFEEDFVSSIFNFATTFNSMSLNDTEIGLFVAVSLMTAERPGLIDTKTIEYHQDKIFEALRTQVTRNHSDPNIFQNLALKLPELRQIGFRHSEHLTWFRANWSRIKLPPLFAEIFDVPSCEEDL